MNWLTKRSNYQTPVYDQALVWITLLLLGFGLVMVYSASIAMAEASKATHHQASYFLVRQAIYLAISVVAALIIFQLPIAFWQRIAPYLFIAGLFLLALVLVPGIGRTVNGSRRWISLVVLNLQPSELMKLFAAIYVADYTIRKSAHMDSLTKGFLPMVAVMALIGFLLLKEPDYGALAVISAISIGILWLGGINYRIFAGLLILMPILMSGLVILSNYRMDRVTGFMDPFADPYNKGYQLSHALIAFGRGEWLGVGLGASVEKQLYLPEAHTDFLMAVIAEELGLLGVSIVILLFAWLLIRLFRIAREAIANERYFAALMVQGIGIWIGVQSVINIGVNMGALPTKGLTLPLLSYGGSGILANCIALAMVLRVDYENRRLQKGLPA